MARKTQIQIEKELREWSDKMQRKGSNVRFVGFGERKPLVLTTAQKAMLKRHFAEHQARSKSSKPAAKRKAA